MLMDVANTLTAVALAEEVQKVASEPAKGEQKALVALERKRLKRELRAQAKAEKRQALLNSEVGTAVRVSWRGGWYDGHVSAVHPAASGRYGERRLDVVFSCDGSVEAGVRPQYVRPCVTEAGGWRERAFGFDLSAALASRKPRWPATGDFLVHLHNERQSLAEERIVAQVIETTRHCNDAREYSVHLLGPLLQRRATLSLKICTYGTRWRLADPDEVLAECDEDKGGMGGDFTPGTSTVGARLGAVLARSAAASRASLARCLELPPPLLGYTLREAVACGLLCELAGTSSRGRSGNGHHRAVVSFGFGPNSAVARVALRWEFVRLRALFAAGRALPVAVRSDAECDTKEGAILVRRMMYLYATLCCNVPSDIMLFVLPFV